MSRQITGKETAFTVSFPAVCLKIVKGLGTVQIQVVIHHIVVEHRVKGILHRAVLFAFPRHAAGVGQQAVIRLALAVQESNDGATEQAVNATVVDKQLPAFTAAGILPLDARLTATSLTGYSGGGKKMIADYESDTRSPLSAAVSARLTTRSG